MKKYVLRSYYYNNATPQHVKVEKSVVRGKNIESTLSDSLLCPVNRIKEGSQTWILLNWNVRTK